MSKCRARTSCRSGCASVKPLPRHRQSRRRALPLACKRRKMARLRLVRRSFMAVISEGKKAPNFTLEDADGKRVSLRDFTGRDVVVYFYPKDDTPGCTKEACGFRDSSTELQRAGVVVLGVSADPPASHAKFAAKYKLPFPLLSDPERKVMEAWGAYGDNVVRQEDEGRHPLL